MNIPTSSTPLTTPVLLSKRDDLVTLPDGLNCPVLKVDGAKNLTGLPSRLRAGRIDASHAVALETVGRGLRAYDLNLTGTAIETLPDDIAVSLRLDLSQCRRLKSLPEGLTVGTLITALESLPRGLAVSFLDAAGCSALRTLPQDMRMTGGRISLRDCARLTSLPTGLGSVGQLDLGGCLNITSVPDDLDVTAWIDIGGSGLTALPERLHGMTIKWRGVPIDARIAFKPDTLSHTEILAETNAEIRRVMLERFGLDRFMVEARAEELDRDRDAGGERRLLRVPLEGDEPLVCVSVMCPSTQRQFVLRVPPQMSSCRQAIAWTAGFDDPRDYKPLLET
jgi:hypothetical protein